MTGTEPPVLRMGREISRQFAHLPPDAAAEAVAAHIAKFWEPRMRRELAAALAEDTAGIDPILRAAGERLTSSSAS